MTLFELFASSMLFVLSKKRVKISCWLSSGFWVSEEFLIGDVPYRLLKKDVVKTISYDGIVEIFVK